MHCRRFDHSCRRFCCRRFGVSPFLLSPFRLVAVMTCIRPGYVLHRVNFDALFWDHVSLTKIPFFGLFELYRPSMSSGLTVHFDPWFPQSWENMEKILSWKVMENGLKIQSWKFKRSWNLSCCLLRITYEKFR